MTAVGNDCGGELDIWLYSQKEVWPMGLTSNACSDYNALDTAQLLELVLVCSWQLNRFFIHCTITSFVLSCLDCVRIAIGEKACLEFTEVCFRVLSSKIDCLEWFR